MVTAELTVEALKERRDALERELVATRQRLRARERQLEQVQAKTREGEFESASTQRALLRSERLLDSWREVARRLERELIDGEERLLQAELRAERLEEALVSIRSGHAYKLMRVIWRLRRPFKRTKGQ